MGTAFWMARAPAQRGRGGEEGNKGEDERQQIGSFRSKRGGWCLTEEWVHENFLCCRGGPDLQEPAAHADAKLPLA